MITKPEEVGEPAEAVDTVEIEGPVEPEELDGDGEEIPLLL